jgi:hypothetical protein
MFVSQSDMKTAARPKVSWVQLRSDLKKAEATLKLTGSLPNFFREQVSVAQAKEEIKTALGNRRERFLEMARVQIYEVPTSPYLRLLRFAGCGFSDLRDYVYRHGLEEALTKLATEGVYLTSDEYKGKKEIRRGNLSFRVSPSDFELSTAPAGMFINSSGTKNKPVSTLAPLEWLALRAPGVAVFSVAHELFSHSHALYDAILPASSIQHLLVNARIGIKTARWFARGIPVNSNLEGLYHWSATHLIVWMGKRFGPGFPTPEFVDIGDVHRVVQWISAEKKLGKKAYIITVASSATRIARVAWEIGVSLEGTKFNVAGEPFTQAKEDAIKRVGATTTSRYSYGGGVLVGYGCGNAIYRDEVHVNQHILAVISHPRPVVLGNPVHPLLLTTLHPKAPRLLLNVENGDYVTLEKRNCGCSLEDAGLTLHLHQIRSFEKFTSEGMNYTYSGIYELLEHAFPAEFGGGPGDYQLVEEEDENAQTRLTLVVHPEVGYLDESQVVARLRTALSNGSRNHHFMTRVWQNAGTFRVRREVPHASTRGKILPLHISQPKA